MHSTPTFAETMKTAHRDGDGRLAHEELLAAIEPLVKKLDDTSFSWRELWPTIRKWLWPIGVEILAFAVLLLFGTKPVGYLLGQILIIVAQLWGCVINVQNIGRSMKSIQTAGTNIQTRLEADTVELLDLAERVKHLKGIEALAADVVQEWFTSECDRWDALHERLFGKISIISVVSSLFAASFSHSATLQIFHATIPTWTLYIWALTLMFLWVLSALSITRVARLRLLAATLKIGSEARTSGDEAT